MSIQRNEQEHKLAIIGIDSLDPHVLVNNQAELPHFDALIKQSATLVSKSVFPVDTIPAWASIYTGLRPGNHGLLYVYDVFDPNLSDLRKLDLGRIRHRTFWDFASKAGYRTVVVYPMLAYPSWDINGVMVSKSPFDRKKDWMTTEIDVDVCPKVAKNTHAIPDKFIGLWGGFPGIERLAEWAELGKEILKTEKEIGLDLYRVGNWDLFFIYFNLLDIIQHRLWRFFDPADPTYEKNQLSTIILDYYKLFDTIIGEFKDVYPDTALMIISDHGHKSRALRTINVNEQLRVDGYLVRKKGGRNTIMNRLGRTVLHLANKWDLQHWLIRLATRSEKLAKASKATYSSAEAIERDNSVAYLSHFAGIKSYSFGGIQVNTDCVTENDYENLLGKLIESLSQIQTPEGQPVINWVKKRKDICIGDFAERLYPDILFELDEHFSVGWDIGRGLFGTAYDHKVASGGHRKEGVLLLGNINRKVRADDKSIIDIAPTVLDFLGVDWRQFGFDGVSIFEP
ncbi:MAG: alkaline phosphatase family protein [Halobacteriota archaeon]